MVSIYLVVSTNTSEKDVADSTKIPKTDLSGERTFDITACLSWKKKDRSSCSNHFFKFSLSVMVFKSFAKKVRRNNSK